MCFSAMSFWDGEQAEIIRMHDGFRDPPFTSYPNMIADDCDDDGVRHINIYIQGKQMYFRFCLWCCFCCTASILKYTLQHIRANKSENECNRGK